MIDPARIAALERELAESEGMAAITDLVAEEARRAHERADERAQRIRAELEDARAEA